jgi:GNAT superfamily N-acetyltransferase
MVTAVVEDGAGRLAFCKLLLESSLPRVTDAARPLELKQLYGDPDVLGQGLGARLMDWALARRRGADEMQLSVWSETPARSGSTTLRLRQGGRGGFHGGRTARRGLAVRAEAVGFTSLSSPIS